MSLLRGLRMGGKHTRLYLSMARFSDRSRSVPPEKAKFVVDNDRKYPRTVSEIEDEDFHRMAVKHARCGAPLERIPEEGESFKQPTKEFPDIGKEEGPWNTDEESDYWKNMVEEYQKNL